VTGLAEILFHLTEIGHEILGIALLVALQIGAGFIKVMAGQTTAILQDAYALTYPDRLEVRLMDEIREASLFAVDRRRGEIDYPPFALDIVNAVAFRARPLSVLASEKIEDRRRRARIAFRRLGTGQKEPRVDEFVLMACGTVENRVILPVPAAIFSPALRIHVAFNADHGRSPCLRLSRGIAGRAFRLGCSLGCFDRAKLILGRGEQIVGLVRRLLRRLFVGGERFVAAIGLGVRGI
jgi:hypothetical protein